VLVVVERRRRDKINTWISHLAELVPECSSDIKLTEVRGTYVLLMPGCLTCMHICTLNYSLLSGQGWKYFKYHHSVSYSISRSKQIYIVTTHE